MAWTLVDFDDSIIELRAVMDRKTEQDEIRKLIKALERRLTKEFPNDAQPPVS